MPNSYHAAFNRFLFALWQSQRSPENGGDASKLSAAETNLVTIWEM